MKKGKYNVKTSWIKQLYKIQITKQRGKAKTTKNVDNSSQQCLYMNRELGR